MYLRRIAVLCIGISGSILTAALLYISITDGFAEFLTDNNIITGKVCHTENEAYEFPVYIPGTTLLLHSWLPYEGPFIEDESDREVVDIASILIQNTGKREVLKCGITIWTNNQCYDFFCGYIPPGAKIALLESGAKYYISEEITNISGWQIISPKQQYPLDYIKVDEQAMSTLVITNISEIEVQGRNMFYKTWLAEEDILVGGITYVVSIPSLAPGEMKTLYPYHFASGYSKIVSMTFE